MATIPLSYKSILNLQRNNAFAVKNMGTADHDHLQLIIKDLGLYHGSQPSLSFLLSFFFIFFYFNCPSKNSYCHFFCWDNFWAAGMNEMGLSHHHHFFFDMLKIFPELFLNLGYYSQWGDDDPGWWWWWWWLFFRPSRIGSSHQSIGAIAGDAWHQHGWSVLLLHLNSTCHRCFVAQSLGVV